MTEDIFVYPDGTLIWKGRVFKCAIGKNGIVENKTEGDGKTPIGCFPIREVFYRKDKIQKPKTILPVSEISPDDGWCNDSNSNEFYNKKIKLPSSLKHENLWREDNIYDCIVVIGYNDESPKLGAGSAIFMHIARENYSGTGGCVALSPEDLSTILKEIKTNTKICVQKNPINL